MQKLVGSILIISATTIAGMMYGMELKEYIEKLVNIRHVLQMIQGEISYTAAPLGSIFYDLSRKVREPYKSWLRAVSKETETREEDQFEKIWDKCAERYLKPLHLKEVHYLKIKEYGFYLGQMDHSTFERTGNAYIEQMDYEIRKLRNVIDSKKKIANCIGIMSGIFIVVMLL